MESENLRLEFEQAPIDVANYILQCHERNAKAAIKAMQEKIEHLQHKLSLAVVAMGRGYTRGWLSSEGRDGL